MGPPKRINCRVALDMEISFLIRITFRDFTPCKLTPPIVYAKLYTMSSGDPGTRKRILESTWRMMEKRQGQDQLISEIARAAGVSRAAMYLHGGTRAGLLIETVRYVDEANHVNERLQNLNADVMGVEALNAIVDFWGN